VRTGLISPGVVVVLVVVVVAEQACVLCAGHPRRNDRFKNPSSGFLRHRRHADSRICRSCGFSGTLPLPPLQTW
jgi:hypothetical protein